MNACLIILHLILCCNKNSQHANIVMVTNNQISKSFYIPAQNLKLKEIHGRRGYNLSSKLRKFLENFIHRMYSPGFRKGGCAFNPNLLRGILNCNLIVETPPLTNSMAYGTRRFNAAFTRALQ